MMSEIIMVGNYAVAGTNKFVSHALRISEPHWVTFCGLRLEYHRNQQWEELDEPQPKLPGCVKCQRAIAAMERRIKSRRV